MVKNDDKLKSSVLLHLCNHDKAPNKDIEKSLGVKGADITRALKSLGSLITTSTSTDNTKPRSLVRDIDTLQTVLPYFNRDLDSQRKFTESPYYHSLVPEMTQRFDDLIPPIKDFTTHADACDLSPHHEIVGWVEKDDDVSTVMQKYNLPNEYGGYIKKCLNLFMDDKFIKVQVDSMNRANNRFSPGMDEVKREDVSCMLKTIHLTDEDKKHLKNALKTNLLALKFVLVFINAPLQIRYNMVTQAHFDASMLSPPPEPESLSYTNTNWDGFFDLLNYLNSNYRFLFG